MAPIDLHKYRMTFVVTSVKNSYPQLPVCHNVQWKLMNYAFSYDVVSEREPDMTDILT